MKIKFTNFNTKQSLEKTYFDYKDIIKDWITISNDGKDPIKFESDKNIGIYKSNVVNYTIAIEEEYYTFDKNVEKIKQIKKSGIEYNFNDHEKIRLIVIGITFMDCIHTEKFPITFTNFEDLELLNIIGNKAVKNKNVNISSFIKKYQIDYSIMKRINRLSKAIEIVKLSWNELECNRK